MAVHLRLAECQAVVGNRERLSDVAAIEQVHGMRSDVIHFECGVPASSRCDSCSP